MYSRVHYPLAERARFAIVFYDVSAVPLDSQSFDGRPTIAGFETYEVVRFTQLLM